MPVFATSRDGTPIAYESHGAGSPALVFVHGWSCNRRYWDAQLTPFAANARVVALDLAGHGESGATRKTWSIAAFGADVAAVVDDLQLDDVLLVGHSMGADVVLEAARHLRSRVRGLVWVDQYRQLDGFRSEAQVRERLAPFRADFADATKAFVRGMFLASADRALVERVATQIASAPREIALGALEATWNYGRKVPAMLAELELPVVSINSQDSATDIESMRRCGVRVIVMPGVGHFPMLENPRDFNACLVRAIRRFLPDVRWRKDEVSTMIEFHLDTERSILHVRPKSALEKDDFAKLAQKVDPHIESSGGLRGLIVEAPSGFPGWDSFGALVAHIRFVRDHHKRVQKVAVVTDSAIGNVAEHLASHFVSAEIKRFSAGQLDAAKQWITSDE